ncbi:ZP domain-containing protein-like [Haliotis rufescens]|uniref:ZP domain-containing protein-like n=1 Tax=Haliotis rufescens TaxID=6454 RepID=UPI00201E9A6A|nr:ZP domain-containing protein-like [Haliotis rufescens]
MQGVTIYFWIFCYNICVRLASAASLRVTCGSQAMEVELDKSYFPGLHGQDLTMRDGGCAATDTPTHVFFTVPLDGCGTQVKNIEDAFVYENQVLSHTVPVKGLVKTVRDVNITVRCYYSNNITARNFYVVDTGELHFTDHNQGAYQISIDLIHNGNSYNPNNSVEPGEELSIKLSLHSNDSHLQVFARSCKATPTDETDHREQYLILDNGCVTESTLTFKDVSHMTEETLTLETFKFVNSSSMVYFHCEVLVCNASDPESRCHHGCLAPGRGRGDAGGRVRRNSDRKSLRADVYLASHHLTAGPVGINGHEASKRTKKSDIHNHKASNPETVRAAVTAGLALLGVVLIMITVAISIVVKSDDEDVDIKDEARERLLDGDE